jgi:hypothetical protein
MILIDCAVVALMVGLTAATSGWLVVRATGSLSSKPPRAEVAEAGGQDPGDAGGVTPGPIASASAAAPPEPAGGAADLDTGRIVGKCENVLIILFVVSGAITGMALIFTAKAFVRQKEFQGNPRYYLVGTLVNTTYSVTMGFLARAILQAIHGGGSLFL